MYSQLANTVTFTVVSLTLDAFEFMACEVCFICFVLKYIYIYMRYIRLGHLTFLLYGLKLIESHISSSDLFV